MVFDMSWIDPLKKISPARWFLLISLPFSVGYVFITPPMQAPDEAAHFLRAYQISQGGFHGKVQNCRRGGDLPVSIVSLATTFVNQGIQFHPECKLDPDFWITQWQMPLNGKDRIFADFPSSVFYPPLPYLPAAAGMWIGKLLKMTPMALFFIGRLCTLGAYLALAAAAIRLMPVQKYALMLIASMPMALFLAASFSADAVTNGLSFLFIATAYRIALAGDISPWRLAALAPLIGLSKTCLPLLGLVGLIPFRRFNSKPLFLIWVGAVIAGGLGPFAGWVWWTSDLYLPQLVSLHTDPGKFFHLFLNTFSSGECVKTYVTSMIGTLGYLDTCLPSWLITGVLAVLFVAILLDKKQSDVLLTRCFRLVNLLVFAFSLLLIALWLFVSCPPPTNTILLSGIQGRYFIPILPCLLAPFTLKRSVSFSLSIPVACWICISGAVTTCSLLRRYYGF